MVFGIYDLWMFSQMQSPDKPAFRRRQEKMTGLYLRPVWEKAGAGGPPIGALASVGVSGRLKPALCKAKQRNNPYKMRMSARNHLGKIMKKWNDSTVLGNSNLSSIILPLIILPNI